MTRHWRQRFIKEYGVEMRLPLPVNLANSRMHWSRKHKEKTAYWEELDGLQLVRLIPGPPLEPFAAVTIAQHWFVGNKMDPDNAYARLKWILDWLRTRGYIAEDRAENVQLGPPRQTIDRKNPRLELILED